MPHDNGHSDIKRKDYSDNLFSQPKQGVCDSSRIQRQERRKTCEETSQRDGETQEGNGETSQERDEKAQHKSAQGACKAS